MTDNLQKSLENFRRAVEAASHADAAWAALHRLADALFGARLFTITTVDMAKGEAKRLYTSDPDSYPLSGTKPMLIDPWYEQVVVRRQPFVKNTLAEIAEHFQDYELIGRLGCGSVLNMPVMLGGEVVGTINCLDTEHHFTPERVAASADMALPALTAFLIFRGAGRH